jgi:transporter family-2 protein
MLTIIVVVIGLIGGIAVGVQSPIAGAMGLRVGGTASSFIIHLSGMVFSGLFLFFRGGEKIRILYQTINVTLPRLGGTMMITLIIVGQLLTGIVIDHFGLLGVAVRPVDLSRILGVIVLLIGGYLISK